MGNDKRVGVPVFTNRKIKTTGRPGPLLVGAVVDRNLSNDLLLFIEENTYEQYGGYNLFQNAEFKGNFSIKV